MEAYDPRPRCKGCHYVLKEFEETDLCEACERDEKEETE
jgi:transposase-like protein